MTNQGTRVGVFVDVPNIVLSARYLYNSRVNFYELLNQATRNRQLIYACAYCVYDVLCNNNERQLKEFRAIGYNPCFKAIQEQPDGARKANWDVGIALDIACLAPRLDIVVLASGDGDFLDLAKFLRRYYFSIQLEIYGFDGSTSKELIAAADFYYNLGSKDSRVLF